jgi:hypothetical protein
MTMVISGSDGVTFPDSTNQFSGGAFSFKNRIINGDMRLNQRGWTSAAVTDAYTVDRWYVGEQTDGAITAEQSTDAPAGFINSLKITVTSTDTSLSATQYSICRQIIEGTNVADLGWGAAGAKTVTVSFWVRSSLTGTFGGSLVNDGFNRSYPFTYSISAANTWEQKSVTIAGDTSGTWLTTTGRGIRVHFSLGSGSDYTGTAGAWAASGLFGATGETNLLATNGATWQFTGVQLEVGSVATPFERRPYGTELQLCQRYYQQFDSADSGSSGAGFTGVCGSTSVAVVTGTYLVEMRAAPTTTFNNININFGGATSTITALSSFASKRTLGADVTVTGTPLTVGRAAVMQFIGGASISNRIAFSSEL